MWLSIACNDEAEAFASSETDSVKDANEIGLDWLHKRGRRSVAHGGEKDLELDHMLPMCDGESRRHSQTYK